MNVSSSSGGYQVDAEDTSYKRNLVGGVLTVGLTGLGHMWSLGIYDIGGAKAIVRNGGDAGLFHNICSRKAVDGIRQVRIIYHSMGSAGAAEANKILTGCNLPHLTAGMDGIVCREGDSSEEKKKHFNINSPGWSECNPVSHLLLFTLPGHTTQTHSAENKHKILNFFAQNSPVGVKLRTSRGH